MRLAVISDIHGNLIALEAVLADLDAQGGAEHLWFLGDFAAFGPRPAESIRRVHALLEADKGSAEQEGRPRRVRAVRGNTDRYLVTGVRPQSIPVEKAEDLPKMLAQVRDRDLNLHWGLARLSWNEYAFLKELESECELHVPGYGHVIGYHAIPGDDEAYLRPETPDDEAMDMLLDREGRLGIGGHIHVQMDRTLPNGWRVVNVGSVGLSFEKPGMAQWGLFTFENGTVDVDLRNVPYDLDAAVADLDAVGFPVPEVPLRFLKPAQ